MPRPRHFLTAAVLIVLAISTNTNLQAQFRISSVSRDLAVSVTDAFTNGVVSVEKGPSARGPWDPVRNIFTTASTATVELTAPDQTTFYRAWAADLTPANNGFNHLIQSYSILSTIAGAGNNPANNLNLWLDTYEGAPAVAVELSRPHIAMADRAGNVYIADKWSHSILKVRPDGILVTAAGNHLLGDAPDTATVATNTFLNQPNGIWVQADGTLHIYDTGNAKVRRVDTNGLMTTLFAIPNTSYVGRGLYVAPDESLAYLCDGTEVKKWTPETGVTVLASGFLALGNLAIDHQGQLVVTDRSDRDLEFGHYVYRIAPDGTRTVIAGNGTTFGGGDGQPALQTGLNEVRAVCFLPTGGYFLGTHRGSQIWYVDTDGIIHLFINGYRNDVHAGDGTYFYNLSEFRVSEVRQITLDYEGNLIICENDVGFIRKVRFLRYYD